MLNLFITRINSDMFNKIKKKNLTFYHMNNFSKKIHTQKLRMKQDINKGKVNIYNNLFVFTFTSTQFSLLSTFKNNIIPFINHKMSYCISIGFNDGNRLHKEVNKEEIILGDLNNDINYQLEVLYYNCLEILKKSLDFNDINYGELNKIYIELKPIAINKLAIKNKGGISKLYKLYNYLICICLIHLTFWNIIIIRICCSLIFYFFMAIFSDISLLLTNINLCTNINWSFDENLLEVNDIKFTSDKIMKDNEIIDSKDDSIKKKFTTNKYFSIFNFNNITYIPSFISKSSLLVINNDNKCLDVNETMNSNLIVPYKTYTSISREALINHINQKITNGLKFNSTVLGTFTSMEDYIKNLNDLSLYRKDICTYNWNIIRNNHLEIDTNFTKLVDRLDIKIEDMRNIRIMYFSLMDNLSEITQEVKINDKVGEKFQDDYFNLIKIRNSLIKEDISNYLETVKIFDTNEKLNIIKEEQLTNMDSHWKAIAKGDDMIKKLKERMTFYDVLVKQHNQEVLNIKHTFFYKDLFEHSTCSCNEYPSCNCKQEKTKPHPSSTSPLYGSHIINVSDNSTIYIVEELRTNLLHLQGTSTLEINSRDNSNVHVAT